jgi:hypothetical protein
MLMETRSVLVVEDERSIQHTLATVLTVVGCTAHRAGNVEIRYSARMAASAISTIFWSTSPMPDVFSLGGSRSYCVCAI